MSHEPPSPSAATAAEMPTRSAGAADPCEPVTVRGTDGATLVVCAYGGHLLSWTPAAQAGPPGVPVGVPGDVLWLSPLARCGAGAAIRGGVPVIFPQFAARGPLPKHGLARDRVWRLVTGPDDQGRASARATLTDDDATWAVWPQRFRLTLSAVAFGPRLTMTLAVHNTGGEPFTFTAALHSYLRVHAGRAALVQGLSAAAAQDNARDGAPTTLPAGPLVALDPRDVAVPRHRGDVRLEQPRGTGGHGSAASSLVLRRRGFEDLVVWNPGPGHGLADVPADGPDGPAGFVCLEPAQLTPVTLAPGGAWQGSAELELTA